MGLASNTVNEHVPTLFVTVNSIADINSISSMISTKAGFSQGQFVLDRKTGIATATEIESDDSETVETITDMRNALKSAMAIRLPLDKYRRCIGTIFRAFVNALDESVADEDVFYFKICWHRFEQDRTRHISL